LSLISRPRIIQDSLKKELEMTIKTLQEDVAEKQVEYSTIQHNAVQNRRVH
jgi:hypothetical protein